MVDPYTMKIPKSGGDRRPNRSLSNHFQISGAVRYSDVDKVCLGSSSRGSVRSALNRRDPEYHLLDGFLNLYVDADLR